MRSRSSLRLRLLLALGAVTLVALGLADVLVYGSLRHYLYNQVDTELESSHRSVESTALHPAAASSGGVFVPSGPNDGQPADGDDDDGSPQGPASSAPSGGPATLPGAAGRSVFCAIGRETAPGMFIEVRNGRGTVVTAAAGREECPAFQPGSIAYAPQLAGRVTGLAADPQDPGELVTYLTTASTSAGGPEFRVRASRLANGLMLFIAIPIGDLTSTLGRLLWVEVLVTLSALLGATLLGLWLVRVGLRPLRAVEQTADAIAAGDLEHRVPDENPRTEVGKLGRAFNVMLDTVSELVGELRASESRLRRFVGDASHELRTPITAISAYAQLLEDRSREHPEDAERATHAIARESARMGRLVEDLLTLARLDEHRPRPDEPVELVGLALEAVETARLVGPDWPIEFAAADVVEIRGDRGALRQVFDNLLANVRAHTPAGTRTLVTVRADAARAIVEVADSGPGFADDDASKVFERFYRADPSRARSTGGAGLGLAIVASIVEAHGGEVHASSARTGGAIVALSFPLIEGSTVLEPE